jgi:enamine deaminase RidA (YjgF/YER057c/UK114 family)
MANIEVRSVDALAGTGVAYAYAVKAGPWLFLTGHEAFDFASGAAPEVEGPAGFPSFGAPRLKREAEYVLKRMRRTLAEFGSDFKHSVRVDQYYPVFEAVRAYQLARHGEFGDYIPPSTSVLMERLFKADSHLSMSLIGVVPGRDYEIGKLYPKEVPVPIGSFFVPAITCNDFVFVAGQMASDENALDPSVRLPKELRNWGGPNAVRRQTEFIIKKRLEAALKAGESSWRNVLKAQIYVPSAADIPDTLDVWQQHVGAHPCALTAVPTKGFGFVDGIVEINLLALRDGAKRRKEVLKVDLPRCRPTAPASVPASWCLPRGSCRSEAMAGSSARPRRRSSTALRTARRFRRWPCCPVPRESAARRELRFRTSCARSGSWPIRASFRASSSHG